MSCLECEPRAEECWEFDQASDEYGVNVEPCHRDVDYYRGFDVSELYPRCGCGVIASSEQRRGT